MIFANWATGNDDIDNLIQKCQMIQYSQMDSA